MKVTVEVSCCAYCPNFIDTLNGGYYCRAIDEDIPDNVNPYEEIYCDCPEKD